MRRFTRLTNAFCNKVENRAYAVAPQFVYYNFLRISGKRRINSVMAAGVTDHLQEIGNLIALIEATD